jgi:hypothetical protein
LPTGVEGVGGFTILSRSEFVLDNLPSCCDHVGVENPWLLSGDKVLLGSVRSRSDLDAPSALELAIVASKLYPLLLCAKESPGSSGGGKVGLGGLGSTWPSPPTWRGSG